MSHATASGSPAAALLAPHLSPSLRITPSLTDARRGKARCGQVATRQNGNIGKWGVASCDLRGAPIKLDHTMHNVLTGAFRNARDPRQHRISLEGLAHCRCSHIVDLVVTKSAREAIRAHQMRPRLVGSVKVRTRALARSAARCGDESESWELWLPQCGGSNSREAANGGCTHWISGQGPKPGFDHPKNGLTRTIDSSAPDWF